jgi:hypothetical protein
MAVLLWSHRLTRPLAMSSLYNVPKLRRGQRRTVQPTHTTSLRALALLICARHALGRISRACQRLLDETDRPTFGTTPRQGIRVAVKVVFSQPRLGEIGLVAC